ITSVGTLYFDGEPINCRQIADIQVLRQIFPVAFSLNVSLEASFQIKSCPAKTFSRQKLGANY
ncbi:MAG: hypothetical protein WBJ35_04395, partial [Acetomicrobium sp.]